MSNPRPTLAETIRGNSRVAGLDVEDADGWFITLRAGWRSDLDPLMPVHCFGATTLTEAKKLIGAAQPCRCEQCLSEQADPS